MKVKRLTIKNVGIIKDEIIELNKPLILFFGQIRQGKTTILNAIRWVFGGTFPEDIIRHGETEASILLELDNGSISREFYKSKDGSTNARPIAFVRDGKPVKKPVDEIKKVLNPLLLNQDFLRQMSETERKVYFIDLFGVDTAELDKKIEGCASEARSVRDKIKGYGLIDLTEVKLVDVASLKTKLQTVKDNYQRELKEVEVKNDAFFEHNKSVNEAVADVRRWDEEIKELETRLKDRKERKAEMEAWLKMNPLKTSISKPFLPDTSALENQIAEAMANEVRYEQYQKNLKRVQEKEVDEKNLLTLEATQRELKKEKIAKLVKIGETSGIKNLTFDETGNFVYEETSAGMLSGSQIMKLSEELSNLYPKDLGIGLIDRAESLGKSVFLLIDRAKEEEKIILATVVGEKPANIPEDVGVWIVEDGGLKS